MWALKATGVLKSNSAVWDVYSVTWEVYWCFLLEVYACWLSLYISDFIQKKLCTCEPEFKCLWILLTNWDLLQRAWHQLLQVEFPVPLSSPWVMDEIGPTGIPLDTAWDPMPPDGSENLLLTATTAAHPAWITAMGALQCCWFYVSL